MKAISTLVLHSTLQHTSFLKPDYYLVGVSLKDWNIGAALWLAASGEGTVPVTSSACNFASQDAHEHQFSGVDLEGQTFSLTSVLTESKCSQKFPDTGMVRNTRRVTSAARVLLVGSGADEQCGGYGRHRTKFRMGGWEALQDEMRLDFQRLWKRNLGRDDRCIGDQGKEARFPFLDEDVISTLLSLPLWEIVDLQQPAGEGDKKILRQVAKFLGLKGAASLPKRAIQFGTRIARESNQKDFGSNRAANQASAGSAILKT